MLGRPGDGQDSRGGVAAVDIAAGGARSPRLALTEEELPAYVAEREAGDRPRWVWSDTAAWYPPLLAAGVRVARAHELRLSHAILVRSALVPEPAALRAAVEWDAAQADTDPASAAATLFEVDPAASRHPSAPLGLDAALAEFDRQRAAVAGAGAGAGRLGLLLAAESAGALIAAEMRAAGVPWDAAEHDRLLHEALGPRPPRGGKPAKMLALADEVRAALADPTVSLDSPPKLLRSLRRSGIEVTSTSRWELEEHDHPAVPPLLGYKKLARLLSANGWEWIDEWVRGGRYRPVYVPGGVVTGRWASSGGGALQLPRALRPALRADPGWRLVSADVAQLEPRVLAAMSGDRGMAEAGRGRDLYAGIVDSGVVASRQEAKTALLGAMYGGTRGDSGRLVPRLRRSFPRAMALVDEAAAAGERGGVVSTWLGRSSPPPAPEWRELQARASLPEASGREQDHARRAAREFGRFTRNFVVQGTAAEWALAWLAELRRRLAVLPAADVAAPARASGPVFERHAHLAFFLHDEVIVHAPAERAEAAASAVSEAAVAASRLLFGDSPVDFPLDLRVSERAEKG
ncbi:bifunctional 3'-5' exonuclease/DNA polymerase [Leucobacter massiliensis]|uniref:DNA-directed DNA polymerase n=1 Tax=Leucobacter massiliensis TaxID=1686285 RepID=A0A2S9QKZ3_9MICO|nr:bifunctional 3'-5' exonuclease/DNA polymerase [Leucobacter massiliensis]PRI10250.1 bifunctional 3'-5' exonuclease/DNA polymerase [Leucobacter massiliensis]